QDDVAVEHAHRTEHVDLAVGEVDDVQDAVDQREPERDEDVEDAGEQADGEPLCDQVEVDLHRYSNLPDRTSNGSHLPFFRMDAGIGMTICRLMPYAFSPPHDAGPKGCAA